MKTGQSQIPRLIDVFAARTIVNRHLKPTPLIHPRGLSRLLGCEVFLKLENLQPTRAFKVRGGVRFMENLVKQGQPRTVITASTGNHAQSVAYAGRLFGVEVKIVMPHGVPQLKSDAAKDLGAELLFHGSYYDEAREYAERLASQNGYLYIHPSNEPLLFEGVATMHLEVIEEQPDLDIVINPIGGGSGASAACIVYKSLDPKIKVIGVQAEGAPAFYNSWKSGSIMSTDGVKTKAEGLATSQAYELPFSFLREKLDDVILVSDAEMMQAVRTIFSTTGQVAELSGAASTAAATKVKEELKGKNVALIVTGGNIEPHQLAQILLS
ncbi:MAG: threonine/serine dehydratase [Candidatus Bathyarchaeia archaeon]